MDTHLVGRLSNHALRLIGVVLLDMAITGEKESRLSNHEILARSGINKNKLADARRELIAHGLLFFNAPNIYRVQLSIPIPSLEPLLLIGNASPPRTNVIEEKQEPIPIPPTKVNNNKDSSVQQQPSNKAQLTEILKVMKETWPGTTTTYAQAQKMITKAENDVELVLESIEKAAWKKDLQKPFAYVLRIIETAIAERVVEENEIEQQQEVNEALAGFLKRREKRGSLT